MAVDRTQDKNRTMLGERFWRRVDKTPGGCWVWTAGSSRGFGIFHVGGVLKAAHRLSYENSNGPVPKGGIIRSTCGNKLCVNPEHLFLDAASVDMRARFWRNVSKIPGGCWVWIACKTSGYGMFSLNGKNVLAHRIAYEELVGPIPDGLFVCHHCDNPSCVNPDHLFTGTVQDNVFDMMKKGRGIKAKGEQHGMVKLSEDDVVEIRRRVAAGEYENQTKLGKEFGVSNQLISRIASRGIWAHV